jgi:hypothetical protein
VNKGLTNDRRKRTMDNYQGVVQNIVMIGDGEYRVTFRAYSENDLDTGLWENEDVPFELYSLIARRKEEEYAFIPEGRLTDCISVLRENSSVETVPQDDVDKWKIGAVANDIVSALADRGMFTPWSPEEEN